MFLKSHPYSKTASHLPFPSSSGNHFPGMPDEKRANVSMIANGVLVILCISIPPLSAISSHPSHHRSSSPPLLTGAPPVYNKITKLNRGTANIFHTVESKAVNWFLCFIGLLASCAIPSSQKQGEQ